MIDAAIVTLVVAVYANLIAFWFEPFHTFKARLGRVGEWEVINCPKCAGLWLGLVTGGVVYGWEGALMMAPLASLSALLVFKLIERNDG